MALRTEKAFGVKMDAQFKMQTAWEIAGARKREGEFVIEWHIATDRVTCYNFTSFYRSRRRV
jgi:plasmid maintenance system antidote protein VapI